MPDEHEKWCAYPNTTLEFTSPAGGFTKIDLRRPVTAADREMLRSAGLTGPFAVFTAENPAGENADDAPSAEDAAMEDDDNVRRQTALERALRGLGVEMRPVDGVAPDGEYRERCVAAVIGRDAAVELARRLRQLAVFWFDGDSFWLLPGLAREEPMKLPPGARGAVKPGAADGQR